MSSSVASEEQAATLDRSGTNVRGHRSVRLDWAAAGGFLLFALLLVWPVPLGRVPVASDTLNLWAPWSQVPHDPVRTPELADSALLFLPWTVFARDAVASGQWPVWDPNSFSGFPFAANSQSQLYYPLTWLLWLLPLGGHIQVLAVFNLWFAGLGTYLFVRRLNAGRLAAFFAGLAFAGSGISQLIVEQWGVSSVYAWLPWVLYTADRALTERHTGWSAGAAAAIALQLVAGHPQYAVYTLFTLAVWVLWRMATLGRAGGPRLVVEYAMRAAAVVAVGVGAALVHLAPLFELSALSGRAGARVSSNSPPLYSLLRSVMPEFYGANGVGAPLVFNDVWYVGVGVLILASLAVVLRPRSQAWLWLALALFAVGVAYGIGPLLYVRWLPGLSGMLPIRIGYLFVFALAVLSALGLDAWLQSYRTRPRRTLLSLVAVLVLAALSLLGALALRGSTQDPALRELQREQVLRATLIAATSALILVSLPLIASTVRRWPRVALLTGPALILLLVTDLVTAVPGYNSFVSPDQVVLRSEAVDWLRNRPDWGRLIGRGVVSEQPAFVPNVQLLYGFPSVAGYDSLHTLDYEDFWAAFDPTIVRGTSSTPYSNVFVRPQTYTSTAAALLGVRYVASTVPLSETAGITLGYSGELRIYEQNPRYPRAFVVTRSEVMDRASIVVRLQEPDFDPARAVLLNAAERPPTVTMGEDAGIVPAEITRTNLNSVEVQVDAPTEGWLVLGDANYPGWSATVNGRREKVYSAYLALRAVPVPAGQSNVVFTYVPATLTWSLPVTLVSLLLLIAGTANGIVRRGRASVVIAHAAK